MPVVTQDLDTGLQLEKERNLKFKGTARVALHWLVFPSISLDHNHVQELRSRIQKDCQRLDSHNHIPVLIGQRDLD